MPYIGRFAPSPSGPLHFGSLIAALGSYLQARSQGGQWLLRIEDIDPPREVAGAADNIQQTLEAHGLFWDGHVNYQSQHSEQYEQILADLQQGSLSYFCQCTRKQIQQAGGHQRHDRHSADQASVRFYNHHPVLTFEDTLQGRVDVPAEFAADDFIIKRKDGLYAYHLASVADDHNQDISEIVRGADLLWPTACQMALFHALGWKAPEYLHLPVAVTEPGLKLSKQNHATALDNNKVLENLYNALQFMHQKPPALTDFDSPQALLNWAIAHWDIKNLPKVAEIAVKQP